MIKLSGKDIERVVGLDDWMNRIESSECDGESKCKTRDVLIYLLWVLTQEGETK